MALSWDHGISFYTNHVGLVMTTSYLYICFHTQYSPYTPICYDMTCNYRTFLSSSGFAKWICHSRHDSCLSALYHEVSNPGDSGLSFSNSPDIWQTPWQKRCRDAWQISERNDHYNIQFRGSETRDLMVRPLTAWWIKTLSYTNWYQTTTRQSNVRIDGILGCNGW